MRPVLWTYTPAAVDVYDPSVYGGLVYHCVDDLGAYPGIDSAAFKARERKLIELADVCLASSKPLLDSLQGMGAKDATYWPNPADVDQYSKAFQPNRIRSERPRIGFVGAIQEHKIDVPLLTEVATMRPNWDIVLVGPVGLGLASSSIAATRWPPNVELVGSVRHDELPDLVADFDAALIPYRLNDYTRGVFPMKVFEYLGAGLGVVSTPLPSLVGEVEHVEFASTAAETVIAVDRILADENRESTSAERMEYASKFSWDARADEALSLLETLKSRDSSGR